MFEEIVLVVEKNGKIKQANQRAREIYGYSRDEFLKLNVKDLRVKTAQDGYEVHQRKDGSTFSVKVHSTKVGAFSVLVIREDEKALFRSLVNGLPFGAIIFNAKGKCVYVNDSAKEFIGWTEDEFLGKEIFDFLQLEEDFITPIKTTFNEEQIFFRRDGSTFYASTFLIPIEEYGKKSGLIVLFQNNDADDTINHLRFVAYHDELTKLPNRSLLNDRLAQSLKVAKRSNEKLAVLFLDLDGFKQINDSFGHRAGDALLQLVAQRLRISLRNSDTIARVGGDEFVILLRSIHKVRSVVQVVKKIIRNISRPFVVGRHKVVISTSIGISLYPDDGTNVDELIHKADMAMYEAKASGSGTYAFYNIAVDEQLQNRMNLENEMEMALKREEFEIYYQPIFSLTTDKVVCAEALIRWRHPKRGILLPDKFIPVAEETALINRIGKWMLEAVCKQIHTLEKEKISIPISVNIAASQFQHENFVKTVENAIRKYEVESKHLIIELVERIAMREDEETKDTIKSLSSLGIRFSLDDFGTGYSNLKYLSILPIDILKIDMSFIKNMLVDLKDKHIVESIIALGKHLKLQTVAEGVETSKHLELLKDLGCDAAQGFYLSPPLTVKEFNRKYTK